MPFADPDRDYMIRTIIGEAGDEPTLGQIGVAHVIMNRINDGRWGNTPKEVVLAPGQFEPWMYRNTRARMNSVDRKSDLYQKIGDITDGVADNQIPDPTNGATYFLAPRVVMQRYGRLPDWTRKGPVAKIGGHNFYNPDPPRPSKDDIANDVLGVKSEALSKDEILNSVLGIKSNAE